MGSSARRRQCMLLSNCTDRWGSATAMDRGGGVARLRGLFVGMAVTAFALCGCVSKSTESTQMGDNKHFDNGPMVISGTPRQDAAAFKASEDRLSEVRYGVLEKKGPKASWEGWFDGKKS